jgi:DNA processing protein
MIDMQAELPELFYWLALSRIKNVGTVTISRLIQKYHSAQAIFTRSSYQELQNLGLKDEVCHRIITAHDSMPLRKAVDADLNWLSGPDRHYLTINDKQYPQLLREIADPPPGLFIQGNPDILSRPQLAIVGSRKATRLGLEAAKSFAGQLSHAGLIITSGLALGIDAASHRGALEASGRTIAVLGSGLQRLYPARHRGLAEQIVNAGGTLISEFPLHATALPHHFPRRNRIISGLSLGTFVVEAQIKSGSLITARMALEQCREVYAMPGSIYNLQTSGCHWLIKQGAKLVEHLDDILEEISFVTDFPDTTALADRKELGVELSRLEHQVIMHLEIEPTAIDHLSEKSSLSVAIVTSTLVGLELKGLVRGERLGYALIPAQLRN